jgi:hypothetical protein
VLLVPFGFDDDASSVMPAAGKVSKRVSRFSIALSTLLIFAGTIETGTAFTPRPE